MKNFSKIVAGMLLAGMTMLCAGVSAEQAQVMGKKMLDFYILHNLLKM